MALSLEITGLKKIYPAVTPEDNVQVFDRIDCIVEKGQFLTIVGPSGCGKTTLLRMVAGLEEITSGEIRLNGERLSFSRNDEGIIVDDPQRDQALIDVADDDELDLVSALGYSAGYIGGGLLFLVNVLMVKKPEWFGLADAGAAVEASFLSVAGWWALFTVPLLRWVEETPAPDQARRLEAVRQGLVQLADTLKEIRSFKTLVLFLVAYWIYIDGVNTVIKTAVFFGDRILGLDQGALITALLLTQFVAFPAALAFGALGQRIGPKPSILIGIGVYLAALVYAWQFLTDEGDFYLLAVAIGLVQGGVQSLSRSLYARLVPPSKSAEFFGFFNMVGKFATIFGPLLMALTPKLIGGATDRDSIISLAVLFVVGGFLLTRVNVEEGVETARRFDA